MSDQTSPSGADAPGAAAGASGAERLAARAPGFAVVALILVAATPVLERLVFFVPFAVLPGPTPLLVGVGTFFSLLQIMSALAAVVFGAITVERQPHNRLGPAAAVVGAIWLTHFAVEQAGSGVAAAFDRLAFF